MKMRHLGFSAHATKKTHTHTHPSECIREISQIRVFILRRSKLCCPLLCSVDSPSSCQGDRKPFIGSTKIPRQPICVIPSHFRRTGASRRAGNPYKFPAAAAPTRWPEKSAWLKSRIDSGRPSSAQWSFLRASCRFHDRPINLLLALPWKEGAGTTTDASIGKGGKGVFSPSYGCTPHD